MTEPRRAVVVGCGRRAAPHIEAYQHLENARVTACYAPSEPRRSRLARRHGITAYEDLDRMLEVEKPDIVHLVTWPEPRVALMQKVAEHGVPLCTTEKPLVNTVADLLALEALNVWAPTKFGVCHQLRWHPHLAPLIAAVNQGEIGEVQLVEMSCRLGALTQGTHALHYGRALAGDARINEVFGQVSGWDAELPGHAAPRDTLGWLSLEGGARAVFISGSQARPCGDGADWQALRVAAHGSHGAVWWEEMGSWGVQGKSGRREGHWGDLHAWRAQNVAAQAGFTRAMFDWQADPTRPVGSSLRAALHEQRALFGLYHSALSGRPVSIRDGEPLPATLVTDLARRGAALNSGESAS